MTFKLKLNRRIKIKHYIKHNELLNLLHYEPLTGIFTWKNIPVKNQMKIGDVAGGLNEKGYIRIKIKGIAYHASRLAWFYMTSKWPKFEIDHEDTNPLNNSWKNLREATRGQNNQNKKAHKNNVTGLKGVSYIRKGNRYSASIKVNHQTHYLGCFKTPEEAHAVYCQAAEKYHGEFARAA